MILYLDNNQIRELTPLRSLTNIKHLNLDKNPMLTNKSFFVKPESICSF
ncbi:leucine-rich repeat domain-containing protein [Microcoleus sp. FACHB-68]|nr:leucine-rich repeat domain-containing protein [Microcoleus sp. FACHB-68]